MVRTLLICLALGLAVAGCKTTKNPASIPAGETVTSPAAAVPAEYARYAGLWAGSWGNGALDSKLMVQSVEPDGKVVALYAWGDNPDWGITAGARRAEGTIAGDTLTLEPFGNGAKVHYEWQPDGSLKGFYERNSQITFGQFAKQ